jgi:hypothetical protein
VPLNFDQGEYYPGKQVRPEPVLCFKEVRKEDDAFNKIDFEGKRFNADFRIYCVEEGIFFRETRM